MLNLLRAQWLLRLIESIIAAISNAEEIDEDDLQQQADHLLVALTTLTRKINDVHSNTSPSFKTDVVDVVTTH